VSIPFIALSTITHPCLVLVNVVFDKKTGLSQKYGFVTVPKETLENIEKSERHRLEGNNIYFQSSE
jgi:hypothetical protein